MSKKKAAKKSLRDIALNKLEIKVDAFADKAFPILRHMDLFREMDFSYKSSEEVKERMIELIESVREGNQKKSYWCEGGGMRCEYHEEDSYSEAKIRLYFDETVYGKGNNQ